MRFFVSPFDFSIQEPVQGETADVVLFGDTGNTKTVFL